MGRILPALNACLIDDGLMLFMPRRKWYCGNLMVFSGMPSALK